MSSDPVPAPWRSYGPEAPAGHLTKVITLTLACRKSPWNRATVLAALLAATIPAQAEVYKCVEDGTGKITFSDVPCHGKDSGGRIVVRPTNQADGSVNRRKAAEDRWEDAQRYQRKAQEEEQRAEDRAASAYRRAQQQAAEAETEAAKKGRRRSAPPQDERAGPSSTWATDCNGGGCWGTDGGRYDKGGGNFYWGPNGKGCHMANGMMYCP